MNARVLPVVILVTLFVGLYWFAGTVHSQDAYTDDYTCYTPDGTWYDSSVPCSFNYDYNDYDYSYPGVGFYFFDDGHHRGDFDVPHGGHHEGGGGGFHGGGGGVHH